MSQINDSIAGFLDALTADLQRSLSQNQTEEVTVSWSRDQRDVAGEDLAWWSCALSIDPACRIYAGTDPETWKEIKGPGASDTSFDDPQGTWFAVLSQSIEQAAKARFGALVSCSDPGKSDAPSGAWAKIPVEIARGDSGPVMYLVLSPDLSAALGGSDDTPPSAPERSGVAGRAETNPRGDTNPLEILQHVEIPVSVSFGRTQMRLKDLLGLANGSVVQLDRELGDEVEIRVNNCVIARGEVVAVNGNYGIRILGMASNRNGQDVRGALRGGSTR
jgi:flagellar motor switch protein FliN/FliY